MVELAYFRAANFDQRLLCDVVEYYVLSSEPSDIDTVEKIKHTILKAVHLFNK